MRTGSPAAPTDAIVFRGIDGLRALAASSVLAYHTWGFSAPDGRRADIGFLSAHVLPHLWHGVSLFFVLSGFLLYRPVVSRLAEGRSLPSWRRYARRRALRILPAYWCILLLTAYVLRSAQELGPDGRFVHGTPDPAVLPVHLLFLQNYRESTLFTGIGPAWSLCVEVIFYALVPVLGAAAFAVAGRRGDGAWIRASVAPVLLLIVIGLTGKAAMVLRGGSDELVRRNFPGLADLFGYGMAVAILTVAVHTGRVRLPRRWRAATLTTLAVLVIVAATFGVDNTMPGGLRNGAYNLMFGLAAALLLALVVLPPAPRRRYPLLSRVLEHRVPATIGVASYSLFLWHEPVIHRLRGDGLTLDGGPGYSVNLLLVATVAGTFSFVTYRCIERPAMRWRRAPRTAGGSRHPVIDPGRGRSGATQQPAAGARGVATQAGSDEIVGRLSDHRDDD